MRKIFAIIFSCFLIFAFGQTLAPPKFSKLSGFYTNSFDLELFHPDPDVKIVYTIDSSEPDIQNLEGRTYRYKKQYPQFAEDSPFEFFENSLKSNLYLNSIEVYDRSSEENRISNISTSFQKDQYFPTEKMNKSFVVRAKAYKDDNSYSETVTNVYFINKTYTLPVVSINVNDDALFGYENGLFVAGKKLDDWRLTNSTDIAGTWTSANYWDSGSSSEVPVNFIYLDDQTVKINQIVGIRNHGNGSRHLKNRSHRIYAKSDYGKKDLKYNFFNDYDINKFKRLILRNSGQDTYSTLFRDAFVQKLNEHLNFDTQNYQPVVSFINGEFYGIYNLRERYDEKYLEEIYGIKEKDIDYIEQTTIVEASIGDLNFYNETLDFFKNNDLSINDNYLRGITYVDEINFSDYHIAQIFAANYDWPYNNNEFFRKRVNYMPDAIYGQDGRFRWLMKDLDISFNGDQDWVPNSYNHNTLEQAISSINYGGEKYENHILIGLLENNNFKNYFINRFADLLNTTYKQERVIGLINLMQNNIRQEMPQNISRWKLINSMDDWENNVELMRVFARLRPDIQKKHLIVYFDLGGYYKLTTRINNKEQGFVKVNTIEINNSTVGIEEDYQNWSGDYFKSIPVTLEAIALPGYKFSHWEGDLESKDQKIIINPSHNFSVKAIFEKTLGIGDLDKVDFIIYPNPVQEILNIASSSKSKIEYKISNIIGQIVEHNSTNNQQIDVSKLKHGVYIIQLTQDNKRITKKFIKK
ncbi:CotH kinase family protein [Empedobacter tilapiae]|uniref:CotH kinase family protein n=1 Tax=Empedobacter tilapiae TaxID=2491114 RepID=UPI0028D2967D|nr:CotH kinase family protein [Empedobacter tilapiae]